MDIHAHCQELEDAVDALRIAYVKRGEEIDRLRGGIGLCDHWVIQVDYALGPQAVIVRAKPAPGPCLRLRCVDEANADNLIRGLGLLLRYIDYIEFMPEETSGETE